MNNDQIREILKTTFAELLEKKPEDFEMKDDTQLNQLGINSIMFIKILVLLEQSLEIEFTEDDLEPDKYETVADLLEILSAKKSNQ